MIRPVVAEGVMEGVLEAIGWMGLAILVVIGLLAGYLASVVARGRNRGRYLAIGVIGAIAAPFVLALIGVGVLAAYGLAAILAAAAVGAAVVLIVAKAIER